MTYLIRTEREAEMFQGTFEMAKNFAENLAKSQNSNFVTIGEDEKHTICCKVRDGVTGEYKPWETIRTNTSY